ncbi:hypothetical protein HRR81_001150 [Exophiala dermatitidis]|nr:hypothetical protein HRR74_003973 [Exophiala dermatitidis]KAJ4529048.1 hypothetical protein HRR73_000068 [Exophiala dermatitidis]KAJ4538446.1 hypothetical protein HRR77_006930 [Exophiala dermatitidis]KAJ4582424.1 hypothetical protein HRR81_001150 [Exophiala dermatitidis]KAJ4613676.1 hypothetical protein HRR85_003971 [Exophiala dermatitidis]
MVLLVHLGVLIASLELLLPFLREDIYSLLFLPSYLKQLTTFTSNLSISYLSISRFPPLHSRSSLSFHLFSPLTIPLLSTYATNPTMPYLNTDSGDTTTTTPSTSSSSIADDAHPSLGWMLQQHRDYHESPGCKCHITVFDAGDIPRSNFGSFAEGLLNSVQSFPLVVEKSIQGLGAMRLEIWGTSARALTSCHFKVVFQLELDHIVEHGWPPASQLPAEPLSLREIQAVASQLRRKRARKSPGLVHHDVLELLTDIYPEESEESGEEDE